MTLLRVISEHGIRRLARGRYEHNTAAAKERVPWCSQPSAGRSVGRESITETEVHWNAHPASAVSIRSRPMYRACGWRTAEVERPRRRLIATRSARCTLPPPPCCRWMDRINSAKDPPDASCLPVAAFDRLHGSRNRNPNARRRSDV